MKIGIVGYGSIGRRHARLLQPSATRLAVVTGQPARDLETYTTVARMCAETMPDYAVICSPTHRHGEQLNALRDVGFTGIVLVEKPVVAQISEAANDYPFTVYVAYNLRFHPVIVALRATLEKETVLNLQAYVGQHLKQWRPERKPQETYSAHRAQGGGVLRDLSHEIDLLAFLFGPLRLRGALVARAGDVTVDSEDSAALLLEAPGCPVMSLMLNYLDPVAARQLHIVTQNHSVTADLITGEIVRDGVSRRIAFTADDSYLAMHRAILSGDTANVCSLAQGLDTVRLIEQAAA